MRAVEQSFGPFRSRGFLTQRLLPHAPMCPRVSNHGTLAPALVETGAGRPSFVSTCGVGDGPPCASGAPHAGLGDLGRLFCSELDGVVISVDIALGQTSKLMLRTPSVMSRPEVTRAMAFVARHKGILAPPVIGNESCRNAIAEGSQILMELNEVNQEFSARSGVEVKIVTAPNVEVKPTESPQETLGTIKTMLIAGAVIVGAVVLAPVIFQGAGFLKTLQRKR